MPNRDTTVLVHHSSYPGAPALTGQAGSLVTLLDAVLVDGYGSNTMASLVVSSGVATCTVSGGHGFASPQTIDRDGKPRILVAGADDGGLNGVFQLRTVESSTVFTFFVEGVSDQTATGTKTYKVAPLGWEKVNSGTNKAAYRSIGTGATGKLLRIQDDGPGTGSYREARATGWATMSDIDTGTIRFPSTAQLPNGIIIRKSSSLDATARQWLILGDDRFFYLIPQYTASYAYGDLFYFGDLLDPVKPADTTHCVISGPHAEGGYSSHPNNSSYTSPGLSTNYSSGKYVYIAEGVSGGLGAPQQCAICGDANISTYWGYGGMSCPLAVDNGYRFSPVRVYAQGQDRGVLPGGYQPLWTVPYAGDWPDVLIGGELKTILVWLIAATNASIYQGGIGLDRSGPWR